MIPTSATNVMMPTAATNDLIRQTAELAGVRVNLRTELVGGRSPATCVVATLERRIESALSHRELAQAVAPAAVMCSTIKRLAAQLHESLLLELTSRIVNPEVAELAAKLLLERAAKLREPAPT